MTTEELDEWGADFYTFCTRFADVFGRKEPRMQAVKYLRGLMSQVPRKNSWQVAEAIGRSDSRCHTTPVVPRAVECGRCPRSPVEVQH